MNNMYSLSEFLKNTYSYIMTKITFPNARFIRRPIYIRGRKLMTGGDRLTTGRFCRFDLAGERPTLHIGRDCSLGDMTHIVAHQRVVIGDGVLAASKCFISDTNHGNYVGNEQSDPSEPPTKRMLFTSPVVIGNNVWIGENAVILAGADIGDGCIIGANSVIKGKIPKNSIVVGTSHVVKKYSEEEKQWVRII